MSDLYRFATGSTPVLISVPHAGTYVPDDLKRRLTPEALQLPDTDWHVDRLYDFAQSIGVGILVATHSRYVIDLNRDPTGQELYPGADNTELVPTTTFVRAPVYLGGESPDAAEIAHRVRTYWRPYHDRLAEELAAIRRRHGVVVLWDAHSIASEVPRFFQGRLPDLNLGSVRGSSADPMLISRIKSTLEHATGFSHVVDGRFTGGYITRRYGRKAEQVHALQMEIAEAAYMNERPPYSWEPQRAAPLKSVLRTCVETIVEWARSGTAKRA